MTAPNLALMCDQHIVEAIERVSDEAVAAMERYVDARRRLAELESIRDLRIAMGADVTGHYKIEPLRETA